MLKSAYTCSGNIDHDSSPVMSTFQDFQMDLLRAVEMSQLQFIADTSRALALGMPEGSAMFVLSVMSR